MINSVNASYAETNGKEQAFQLAANANIYEILTSKIYTNPIEAVVRELISNAIDSGGRVFVTIPTSQYAANFVVEDSGCGMTAEEVDNIYSTYGASNKTNSNDKIGGLGIGAKSPLAYTSQFELSTGKNGVKHTYLMHMSSEGIPCKIDAGEEKSDWTGTKVTVSVKDDDCTKFQKAILKVCLFTEKEVQFIIKNKNIENFFGEIGLHTLDQYNELRAIVKNESIIKTVNHIFVNENNVSRYSLSDFFKSEIGSVCVNMGGVCYKVDINKTFADYDKYRDLKNLITDNLMIILNSPIGSLSFQASREELNYTDDTIGKIRKLIMNVLEKELEKNFDEKTNSLQDLAFNVRNYGHVLRILADLDDSTAISLKDSVNIKLNNIKSDIDVVVTKSRDTHRSVFIGDWQNVGIYKYIAHCTYNSYSLDNFLYMLTNVKRIITYNADINFNDSNIFTSSQIKIISKSNLKNSVVSTNFILIPEETLAAFKKYITNITEEKYEDLQSDYKAKMKLNRSTKAKAEKLVDPIFVCRIMGSTREIKNYSLSELIKMSQPKVLCVTNAKLEGHGYNIPKCVQSVQIINVEKWWNKTNSKINTYDLNNFMNGFKYFVNKGLIEELPVFVYATLGEFRDAKVQKLDNFFSIDTYLKEFVNINALDKIEPLIQASFDMSLRSVEFIAGCIESDKDSHFYTDNISSSSPIIDMINFYKENYNSAEEISTMSYFIAYVKDFIYQLADEKTKAVITEKLDRLQSKTVVVNILDKYPMLQAAAEAWRYSSTVKYQKCVCDYINLVDRSEANK